MIFRYKGKDFRIVEFSVEHNLPVFDWWSDFEVLRKAMKDPPKETDNLFRYWTKYLGKKITYLAPLADIESGKFRPTDPKTLLPHPSPMAVQPTAKITKLLLLFMALLEWKR